MNEHPELIKTIVTMELAERIAQHYGVETVNVFTGFKFIGEGIGKLKNRIEHLIISAALRHSTDI